MWLFQNNPMQHWKGNAIPKNPCRRVRKLLTCSGNVQDLISINAEKSTYNKMGLVMTAEQTLDMPLKICNGM